ncbi:hypothetical protein Tco_0691716 [Tanacetum coccineum]
MANLKFADTHNMVAFLSKPEESDGFEQIVDFLNAHPIKYALTVNPTIYISCIEQFWSTVKAKTINGEVQLHALVDGKKIIITESTVRRDLQLEDAEGVDCLPNSTIFEQLTLMGSKTTAWNEFSSTMASAIICLATNQKFNFSKYIFESMIRNLDNLSGKFLMYPRNMRRVGKGFSGRVTPLFQTMVVQNQSELGEDESVHKELGDSLVRAATTTKTRSKATPNESSSVGTTSGGDPGGNTLQSDEDRLKLDELMTLCTTLQNRVFDLEKTKTTQQNEIASLKRRVKKLEKKSRSRTHKLKRLYKVSLTARVESSGDEESLGQYENVVEEVVDAAQVSTAATTVTDKCKGIIIEEPVKSMKKKDQINFDEETALKLQAEFDEEERLAREKAKKEKKANIALIEEWDDIQAKIDDDHQLAERLQVQEQEELFDAEKAILFQQLLKKRRKHFATKRAEEKRNKPPTKAQ